MEAKVEAKLDKRGSENTTHNHYTFGKRGDIISGGFYIDKAIQNKPDFILIEIKEEKGR